MAQALKVRKQTSAGIADPEALPTCIKKLTPVSSDDSCDTLAFS